METFTFILLVLIVLLVFLAVRSIRVVRQYEVIIIERLGRFHHQATSGLQFIVPIIDQVVAVHDLRTQVVDSEPQPVITRDNVTMSIDTVVYYQITDPFKATYEIAELRKAISYLTLTTLRDVIGQMELDKTLSSRDEVNTRLRSILDEATDRWGVRVERVEVKNIDPPADVRQAMEAQMRAEREKRAVILTAEGEREATIARAEGQRQSAILQAEGERDAAIARAEGEAQAIERMATATARRLELTLQAMKDAAADEGVLRLRSIEALEAMAGGSNKVFVPYDAAALLGSAAAIGQVFAGEQDGVSPSDKLNKAGD